MKKQMFRLMVSAAIFMTNPLFAMGTDGLEDPEGGRIHVTPSSNSELAEVKKKETHAYLTKEESTFVYSYTPSALPNFGFGNGGETIDRGVFSIIPDDAIINLDEDHPIETLLTFSKISKSMYNWCQKPDLWEWIANKVTLVLDARSMLSIKDQVLMDHAYYLNLFSIWGLVCDDQSHQPITYMLRKSQFEEFLKTPCVTTWFPNSFEKAINYVAKNYKAKPQSYFFSKGSKDFVLYVPNKDETVEEALEKRKNFTFEAGDSGLFNGEAFTCGMRAVFIIKEIKPIAVEDPASESQ